MPTHSLYLTTDIPTTVPEIPNISCIGDDNSIIVTFSPNGDGGSVITGYEYSIDNFIADINPIGVNSSPYTITGLQDGTSYNIEIRAVNKNGYGEKTNSPDITPTAIPSAPTITSITTASNQATISYSAPTDNGGSIIEYYIITYSLNNFVNSTIISPVMTNPYVLSSLTNGLTYKFKIQAKNSKGIGIESVPYEITLPTTPSAPTITSITKNNSSALVYFTAGNDGDSIITNYKYSTNGGTTFTLFSPTQTTSPLTISGLTNGITYQIQIKAVNSIGDSSASNTISVTPSTTPSAPTINSITAGDTSASVNFTAGNNGGSTITNYKYSTNGGTTFTLFSPAQTTSPLTISGLTNGNTYQIQIKALNENGDGASSASVSVTPSATPLATGGTSLTSGTYKYHIFTTTGTNTITFSNGGSIEYLIIGGGGAGGSSHGGGGGAGEVVSGFTNVSSTSYSIIVGAGGSVTGSGSSNSANTNGADSSAFSISAKGGGRGGGSLTGAGNDGNALSGGSGGGGAGYTNSINGAVSNKNNASGLGNSGGNGYKTQGIPNAGGGGGGGGAGGSGSSTTNYNGAVNGAGTNSYSEWINAIASTMNTITANWSSKTISAGVGYIASGGAGGSWTAPLGVSASIGGGGDGGTNNNTPSNPINPTNGTANTGGGGGGGGSGNQLGANGGSGLVVVRYLI